MGKIIDLTGQRFGKLTVKERDFSKKSADRSIYWICLCDCGTEKSINGRSLRTGNTKSCGCLQKEKSKEFNQNFVVDLTGKKFERLKVLKRDLSKNKGVYWLCECECGNLRSVLGNRLKSGETKSCGCLQKERSAEFNQRFVTDLKGQKFGKLTVLEKDNTQKIGDGSYWLCRCECGNIKTVKAKYLQNNSVNSCGCMTSKGENKIESLLKELKIPYLSQYSFKDLKGKENALRFDFALFFNEKLMCLIEYQGKQHYEAIEHFGGEERFQKQKIYDGLKREYCQKNNIKLIEISYLDFNKLSCEYLLNLIK